MGLRGLGLVPDPGSDTPHRMVWGIIVSMDYTSQLGAVDPQIVKVANEVGDACLKALGRQPKQLWGYGPNPEHNNRRCIDFMVYGDKEMGDWISGYIWKHRSRLGLLHLIWYQRIISVARASEGWRSMSDRGDATQNHRDHPHVNFQNLNSYTAPDGSAGDSDTPPSEPVSNNAGTPTTPPTTGQDSDCWIMQTDKGLMFTYQDGSQEFVPEFANGRFRGPKKLRSSASTVPSFTADDDDATTAPGGKGGVKITAGMIEAAVAAVGGSLPTTGGTAADIANQFNVAVDKYFPGILSSKKRAACLIGQCAQETAGFRYMAEIGGSSATYAPWYGRGYTQLTHGDNYKAFGAFVKSKGGVTDANYFYSNPDAVATKSWAALTAVWYFGKSRTNQRGWNNKSLFEWCDTASSPWTEISKGVNCGNPLAGYTGYGFATRTKATNAVLAVTPDPVAPKPTTTGVIKPVDDYPFKGSHSGYDKFGWAMSQCVSFCGWRVRSRMGIPKFHNWWGGINFGNAKTWVAAARYTGVPVLTTPKVDTIAVRMSGGGGAGHVAHVIEVNSDGSFDIEDYNGSGTEAYAYRPNRAVGSFDYFLDFKAYVASGKPVDR